ncbi:MAG: hypothetical protein FJ290_10875 [Planctomycetes bacterium]|nr:hypothetical protein [Planctomycetota bacterium]
MKTEQSVLCTLRVSFLALLLAQGLCPLRAGEKVPNAKGIKPGDRVRITIGPAPVTDGGKTLAVLKAGAELVTVDVEERRVKVTVKGAGEAITGWIENEHLKLATPEPPPKKAPKEEKGAPDKPAEKAPDAPDEDADMVTVVMTIDKAQRGELESLHITGCGADQTGKLKPGETKKLRLKKGRYSCSYVARLGGGFEIAVFHPTVERDETWDFTFMRTQTGVSCKRQVAPLRDVPKP